MRQLHWVFVALPILMLCLAPPAGAADDEAEQAPATTEVRRGPLGDVVTLKGLFVPTRSAAVACEPEAYGGPLEIVEAAREGPVVKGQILVQFKEDDLRDQIAEKKAALALARIKVEDADRDAVLKAQERTLAMDEAVRRKRRADEALDIFAKVDRTMREAEAILRLEGSKDRLQNDREELDQLEKMYKADDLTEETEEIVLRRTRRSLERSLKSFEFQKQRHEWFMTLTLPRELEDLRISVRKATAALERLKATAPLDAAKTKLELENARKALADQERAQAKLEGDLSALALKAPFAGYAVPGTLEHGQWGSLTELAETLEPGAKVKARQTLFTVVDPTSLVVATSVKEGDLVHVKRGLPASLTSALTGEEELEAEVTSVARYGVKGSYAVRLRLRKPDERLRTGAACSVKITQATSEEALSVPASAVLETEGKFYVFVCDGESVEKVLVKVGRRAGDRVEILDGLKAGQRILEKHPPQK